MKIQSLLCPVVLIIFAVCIEPECVLRGVDAAVCKLKWQRQLRFMVRKGWSQKEAVAYEDSLYKKFLKSRAESSCLSDQVYAKKVAGKFYLQNRHFTADDVFNQWLDALDDFSRGDLETNLQRPDDDHQELSDIKQLLSWFVSFLDAVVKSACPYLTKNWSLPNSCYVAKLSLSERTKCFSKKAALDEGVQCGESYFSPRGDPGTVLEFETCAETVHREVQSWSVQSRKKTAQLTNLFVLALFELEESYQNKIQPGEKKPKLDLSGQLGKHVHLLLYLCVLLLFVTLN